MKLQGIAGKGSGKLGAYVWVVRKGEQILREYTGKVNNPKSTAQSKQRAKFKLMSQLSAVVADGLAFVTETPSESQRNAFTRNNFANVTVVGDAAQVNMSAVKLASGRLIAPEFRAESGGNALSITMVDESGVWQGFGYAFVMSKGDGTVSGKSGRTAAGVADVEIPGIDPLAQRSDVRVYAWRFASESAEVRYQNITAGSTPSQMRLQFASMLATGDIITSETVTAVIQG